jgi:hypothetical protein
MGKAVFAVLIALGLFGNAAFGEGREFSSGYAGTLPPAKEDRAKTYFYRPEVQRLLTALEKGPLADADAAKLVEPSTRLDDLVRIKLVARDGGRVRIGFAYFTASDMAAVHAAAAKYAPSLSRAFADHRAQFDAIFARYPVKSISRDRLAFVLIAGFALNWDGLALTEEQGFRQPVLVAGEGWSYSFWASEDVPGYSYKGYYWGSSTFPAGKQNLDPPLDFAFSSFGDPDSDPRMNFPDLFTFGPDEMPVAARDAARPLLHDDATLNLGLKNVIGLDRARDIGALLFALRNGATSSAAICGGKKDCARLIDLLIAACYVRRDGADRYALLVPVFDTADAPMVAAALKESRAVVADWLRANMGPMQSDLSDLIALRQGVPFGAVFTQVWHEIFGLTTRELVNGKMIEDPRGPTAPWTGSIPAVWRHEVYRLKLG